MTRNDVISMARDAGSSPYTNRHIPERPFHTFSPEALERFAALVAARAAAAEREACAEVCEERTGMRGTGAWTVLIAAAAAIRARGTHEA